MKKAILLVTAALFFTMSYAAPLVEPVKPVPNAKNIYIPIGKTDKKISLMELSKISMKDLQSLTGRKMNAFERFAFKSTQKKLKKSIAEDGTITKKKIAKLFQKRDGESGFHLGGFALGFLLGLIGVLIAYLINDDLKRNRVKWAWIGWGIWLVIWIILLVAVF